MGRTSPQLAELLKEKDNISEELTEQFVDYDWVRQNKDKWFV